jgi:hypothetical protein
MDNHLLSSSRNSVRERVKRLILVRQSHPTPTKEEIFNEAQEHLRVTHVEIRHIFKLVRAAPSYLTTVVISGISPTNHRPDQQKQSLPFSNLEYTQIKAEAQLLLEPQHTPL